MFAIEPDRACAMPMNMRQVAIGSTAQRHVNRIDPPSGPGNASDNPVFCFPLKGRNLSSGKIGNAAFVIGGVVNHPGDV